MGILQHLYPDPTTSPALLVRCINWEACQLGKGWKLIYSCSAIRWGLHQY